MRTDPDSLTPRERQVRAELKRLACVEAGGHHYVDSLACSECGEPYPVIFYGEGEHHHHVEHYMNGNHFTGHGAAGPATRAEAERVFRKTSRAWERLGFRASEATSKLSRLTSLIS